MVLPRSSRTSRGVLPEGQATIKMWFTNAIPALFGTARTMPPDDSSFSARNYPPVFEIKRFGLINDLAVSSAYRRNGIGRHLFFLAKKWLARKGIKRIEITGMKRIHGKPWRLVRLTQVSEKRNWICRPALLTVEPRHWAQQDIEIADYGRKKEKNDSNPHQFDCALRNELPPLLGIHPWK